MAIMFPYLWRDGTWREGPEPRPEQEAQPPPKPKQWVKRGFFLDAPLPRSEVAIKANNARLWLSSLLYCGPRPAKEVYRQASAEGFSHAAIKRAKKHLRVKSVKVGGTRQGWGAVWVWKTPKPVSD